MLGLKLKLRRRRRPKLKVIPTTEAVTTMLTFRGTDKGTDKGMGKGKAVCFGIISTSTSLAPPKLTQSLTAKAQPENPKT